MSSLLSGVSDMIGSFGLGIPLEAATRPSIFDPISSKVFSYVENIPKADKAVVGMIGAGATLSMFFLPIQYRIAVGAGAGAVIGGLSGYYNDNLVGGIVTGALIGAGVGYPRWNKGNGAEVVGALMIAAFIIPVISWLVDGLFFHSNN